MTPTRRHAIWLTLLCLILGAWQGVCARDLASMNGDEVTVLQQRLANAGCYRGAIDGRVSAPLQAAMKACPDQQPTLRIETGMHVAQMSGIQVDSRCTLAVTGAEDKTIRLWSMPDGKPLRVQRLPIDGAAGGRALALAVSPDARWIAAGLDDAHVWLDRKRGLYLFDAATGTNVRRIGAIDDALVVSLAFSPDGRRLAAATHWGGLRVFDVATGRLLMQDQYARRSSSYGVAYGPDGALFAVGEFGFITRYDLNLRRTARVKPPHSGQAFSIAVQPTGQRIAVGYAETPMLDLFDARDLHYLATPDLTGVNGDLAALAWSSDGQRLIAGGKFDRQAGNAAEQLVRSWTVDGKLLGDDVIRVGDPLVNLAPCGEQTVFLASDTGFGLLDAKGTSVLLRETRAPIMEGKVGSAFMVSASGARVKFGLDFANQNPVVFDASAGTLTDAPANLAGFVKPRVEGLPMKNWFLAQTPEYAGKPFNLELYEMSASLAIRADLSGLVLGTRAYIRRIDASGRQVWAVSGPGSVWGVNLAKDDDLIVAAYSDGTVRWRRWSDGAELLALFVDAKDRRWVAWTPTGYYMASPGGEDLIGWQLNRGWEQQADFFPASRFRDRFNRPDIVRLALETLDEGEAVRRADESARRREDLTPLGAKLPPVIRIEAPPQGGRQTTARAKLDYGLRAPSGLPVDRIDVLIDGRPAKEVGLPLKTIGADVETRGTVEIDLPPHDVEIGLIAWSGDIASDPARIKLTWGGPKPEAERARKLRALIVGVSDYISPEMTLAYAAKDARDFAAALQRQKGGYYADVDVKLLTDRAVTRQSLISGLEWLEKQKPGADDVSVLFLAGHGLTDEKQTYWYLPADSNEDEVRAKGVSQNEIRETLQGLDGKVLWFLDTCHAGGAARPAPVDVTVLVNRVTSAESGGIVAFASSTGREVSVESTDWMNGAFTKAIVEGIDLGKADLFHEGNITTSELDAFVERRVGELTQQRQHPVMGRPPEEPDFTIAQARK